MPGRSAVSFLGIDFHITICISPGHPNLLVQWIKRYHRSSLVSDRKSFVTVRFNCDEYLVLQNTHPLSPTPSRYLMSLPFPRQLSSQPMRIVKLPIEYGRDIALALVMFHRPFKHIWHGSRENGNKYPTNCRSWLSSSSQDFSTASALNGRELALAEQELPCSSNLIVLCVQINPARRRRFRSSHKFVH